MKEHGAENCFLEAIKQDPAFKLSQEEIDSLKQATNFTGRSAWQVHEFIEQEIAPIMP